MTVVPRGTRAGHSGRLFGLPLRRSDHPVWGGGLGRRTVQDNEVGSLPRKGRLLTSLGLSLVSVPTLLRGLSSVCLPPVPRDDHRKFRGFSREFVEPSQRSAANDDTNRLLRRCFGRAPFLYGLGVFARHSGIIGSDPLQLLPPHPDGRSVEPERLKGRYAVPAHVREIIREFADCGRPTRGMASSRPLSANLVPGLHRECGQARRSIHRLKPSEETLWAASCMTGPGTQRE
jgi:hypothetical protein